MMSEWNLPDLIDHTVLRPDATKIDVLRLCKEAKEYRFTVIFVPLAMWMKRWQLSQARRFV